MNQSFVKTDLSTYTFSNLICSYFISLKILICLKSTAVCKILLRGSIVLVLQWTLLTRDQLVRWNKGRHGLWCLEWGTAPLWTQHLNIHHIYCLWNLSLAASCETNEWKHYPKSYRCLSIIVNCFYPKFEKDVLKTTWFIALKELRNRQTIWFLQLLHFLCWNLTSHLFPISYFLVTSSHLLQYTRIWKLKSSYLPKFMHRQD